MRPESGARRGTPLQVEALELRAVPAGIVTPHYEIPDFGASATLTSDSSGAWSDANTWSAGRVPTANDIVAIAPGTTVTYDVIASPALDSVVVYAGGVLTFRTDLSTQLLVTHLQVLEGGELRVGTEANPVQAAVTAQIVIRNVALDATRDPEQFGNGLVGLGKVTMHGSAKLSEVRLAAEPLAGQTTITLAEAATGWQVGDRLIFPDSKQWAIETYAYSPSYEDATIAALSADGKTITLAAPLLFDHPGARNGDGVLEFLPHVANRSRNVTIKSESGSGVRGYTLFTGRADVDIRYVTFQTLGRTTLGATGPANHADRHPVTFAHLYGPAGGQANGYQYTFIGNSIFCGMPTHNIKWGVAINDSHYGLIQGNFLYNWQGAGLITVSGNESYNVIADNIVIRGRGVGDRIGSGNLGDEGSAFWFRGPNNYVRDNVGANYTNMTADGHSNGAEAAYGFKYVLYYLGNVRIPNFAGADTTVAGQYTVKNGNAMPLLEFARNETYGTENGLTFWWLNAIDTAPQNGGESVVRDFRGWHIARYGYYGYPISNVTFDGYVIRGNKAVLSNVHEQVMGMWFGDYMTKDLVVRRADIQGVRTGIIDPYFSGYSSLIEDSYLRNNYNIVVRTIGAPGSGPYGPSRGPKSLTIRNVRYGSTAGWSLGSGNVQQNIVMSYTTHNGAANLIASDTVFVYDYDGGAGQNYQVYYPQQAAAFIVPQASGNLAGSPVAGLTNQQNWDQYGIAIAGAVAPVDALPAAWTNGLVRTLSSAPDTTPPTISGVGANNLTASGARVVWTTNEAADTQVEYGLTTSYGSSTPLNSVLLTGHVVNLSGLTAGTTYHYRVKSRDAAGNLQTSSDFSFSTAPPADTTPPAISGILASNLTSTSAVIAWITNELADTQVEYGLTTSYGSSTPLSTALIVTHSVTLSGLEPGMTYNFRVKSRDVAGNLTASDNYAFTTTSAIGHTQFYVVNDASLNETYEYGPSGALVENYGLNISNVAPRGVATTAAGTRVWVVDANRNVFVYDSAGDLLGNWRASDLAASASPEGIATDGTDIWIVDSKSDQVYCYRGAANRLSGTQAASYRFQLDAGNGNARDLVTDGASLWVVNATKRGQVFKYTVSGLLLGSWNLDADNIQPTGITIDPAMATHIWVVDSRADKVFQYSWAAARVSGSQSADASFQLADGNDNPQGIADPPAGRDIPRTALDRSWDKAKPAGAAGSAAVPALEQPTNEDRSMKVPDWARPAQALPSSRSGMHRHAERFENDRDNNLQERTRVSRHGSSSSKGLPSFRRFMNADAADYLFSKFNDWNVPFPILVRPVRASQAKLK